MCVYVYTYMYMYIHMYLYLNIHIYICTYVHIHDMTTDDKREVQLHINVKIYNQMCIHIYTYIYIYIYISPCRSPEDCNRNIQTKTSAHAFVFSLNVARSLCSRRRSIQGPGAASRTPKGRNLQVSPAKLHKASW